MYYFDILNGPTYTELVKEKPELRNKSPEQMGIRPFFGLELESCVVGLKMYIRMEHIYEALKLSSGGLILKGEDPVGSDVQEFLYEKDA
jgi:hypothetical protein